ncbi:MAG: PilN domain-containing protein [Thermodesulfovibrionales bacterium]
MIRINLLQIKRKKKAKPLPSFIVLAVFLSLVAVLGVAFIYIGLTKQISTLETIQKNNAVKMEELKRKVKEVDDFEAKIKTFQERKGVLETLRKNQSVPIMILNEISSQLADGVWLSEMSLKAMAVNLKGYAFTNSNVVEFVNNLKRSSLFTDVYLEESKETNIEKIDLYEFKLKFVVRPVQNG